MSMREIVRIAANGDFDAVRRRVLRGENITYIGYMLIEHAVMLDDLDTALFLLPYVAGFDFPNCHILTICAAKRFPMFMRRIMEKRFSAFDAANAMRASIDSGSTNCITVLMRHVRGGPFYRYATRKKNADALRILMQKNDAHVLDDVDALFDAICYNSHRCAAILAGHR